MSIQKYKNTFKKLSRSMLLKWVSIPCAIVSDAMNRSNAMAARISPLSPGMRIIGQARTVSSMVGDNAASHVAIGVAREGEILVIDACGHLDTAVWGGIMTRAAIKRNLGGVVIDGGVRDVAEIRELNFPTFVAGVVPRGPSKGFGGVIDSSISCGGCSVSPGDLIIGDDDGVVVIPLRRHDEVLKESIIRIRNEEKVNSETESGRFPYETFDFEIDTIT